MYTQPECSACEAAKAWLAERGVAARICDIREDHQTLYDFMDTGSRTTPTLIAGDRMLEGFEPGQWADALGVAP